MSAEERITDIVWGIYGEIGHNHDVIFKTDEGLKEFIKELREAADKLEAKLSK